MAAFLARAASFLAQAVSFHLLSTSPTHDPSSEVQTSLVRLLHSSGLGATLQRNHDIGQIQAIDLGHQLASTHVLRRSAVS